MDEGRQRADITFDNTGSAGFFGSLRDAGILCPYVFFECKNISNDPSTPETSQISSRLNDERGKAGVIVCRNIDGPDRVLRRQKDYLKKGEHVFILQDKDIEEMLEARANSDVDGIGKALSAQLRAFKLNQ